MPITLHQGSLKYKNQQGNFTDIDCIKGDDYVLTAQDKEDIAGMVDVPVSDVQVNGTSIVQDGVANVPVAGASTLGTVKVSSSWGLRLASNEVVVNPASVGDTKAGTNGYKPIVSSTEYSATFYGLAKAAGDTTQSSSSNAVGTYTESAKSAISQMLNSPVTITGSTPTITALPGIQYICGECATLDITLPDSGIVDVIFQSGSIATVLTVPPPTGKTMSWANWFDPTSLDANTTYELNIAIVGDQCLGVTGSWT